MAQAVPTGTTYRRTVVDYADSVAIARLWGHALETVGVVSGPAGPPHVTLFGLVMDLSAALEAESFDAAAGMRIGAALWATGLVDSRVPSVSAQVLFRLADYSRRIDAHGRLAGLLAALGQGHQKEMDHARRVRREFAGQTVGRGDLDERVRRFRILYDNTAMAIALADTDGRLVEANRGLADIIGVPVEALPGMSVYDFADPDDRDDFRTLLYERLVPDGGGTVLLDRRLTRADGSVRWMSFAISYVRVAGDHPDYLLTVGVDVTKQHLLEEELRRQARHDTLTGLPNRRYLLERMEELVDDAVDDQRAGLCFVDLDHFKFINDRFGHLVGDRVLVTVALRLRDRLRGCGCFVSRLSGDEFVVLVPPPVGSERIAEIAERLLSVFSEPIVLDGYRLDLSASIGAVVTPVGADPEALLDAADASLYDVKANGKGHWVVHHLEAL